MKTTSDSPVASVALPQILACDPRAGFQSQQAEIEEAILRVLESGRYMLGPEVESFEQEFAAYVGASHAVGVASGTDAISVALRACGVGHGDVVLTVSHTAVATIAAIESIGAVPVLVDIDPVTFTMNPECLRETLRQCSQRAEFTGRMKAVVPVHLYGLPADMPNILEISREYQLRVIEDCSQAHGAEINGKRVGTFGDFGAFSLYPTKNLGAMGDAGIITTNRGNLAEAVRSLRQYGWKQRNVSETPGLNSRLDELQAAILRVRLRNLDRSNAARGVLARTYDAILRDSHLVVPRNDASMKHVYHQFVVKVPRRDDLKRALLNNGIETLIHYPLAVHQQPAYRDRLTLIAPLERTVQVVGTILSLPMYPELSIADASRVATTAQTLVNDLV